MKNTTKEITHADLDKQYADWDLIDTVQDLSERYHDLVVARNRYPYKSARYNKAVARLEILETYASLIVFCDTAHSMSECVNGEEDCEI